MENSEEIMMKGAKSRGAWWLTIGLFLFFIIITALLALGTGLGMLVVDEASASFGIGVVFTLAVIFFFLQLFMRSGDINIKM